MRYLRVIWLWAARDCKEKTGLCYSGRESCCCERAGRCLQESGSDHIFFVVVVVVVVDLVSVTVPIDVPHGAARASLFEMASLYPVLWFSSCLLGRRVESFHPFCARFCFHPRQTITKQSAEEQQRGGYLGVIYSRANVSAPQPIQ